MYWTNIFLYHLHVFLHKHIILITVLMIAIIFSLQVHVTHDFLYSTLITFPALLSFIYKDHFVSEKTALGLPLLCLLISIFFIDVIILNLLSAFTYSNLFWSFLLGTIPNLPNILLAICIMKNLKNDFKDYSEVEENKNELLKQYEIFSNNSCFYFDLSLKAFSLIVGGTAAVVSFLINFKSNGAAIDPAFSLYLAIFINVVCLIVGLFSTPLLINMDSELYSLAFNVFKFKKYPSTIPHAIFVWCTCIIYGLSAILCSYLVPESIKLYKIIKPVNLF